MKLILLTIIVAVSLCAQSAKNAYAGVDASGAPWAKPATHVAADPATPCSAGRMIFRTDLGVFRYCNGSQIWADFGGSVTAGYGVLNEGGAVTWNPVDPRYVVMKDEFMGPVGTAGSYGVGEMSWRYGNNGTCSASLQTGDFTNPGAWGVSTGSTSGNGCWLNFQSSGAGPSMASPYANGDRLFDMVWIAQPTSTTAVRFYVGLQGLYSGDPPGDKGFYFRFSTVAGDSTFKVVTRSSSTETSNPADTGVSYDGAYHTFRIYTDGTTANKLYFSIDGGSPKTICASGCDVTDTIPTGNFQPFISIHTAEAATKFLRVDAFMLRAKVGASAGKRN